MPAGFPYAEAVVPQRPRQRRADAQAQEGVGVALGGGGSGDLYQLFEQPAIGRRSNQLNQIATPVRASIVGFAEGQYDNAPQRSLFEDLEAYDVMDRLVDILLVQPGCIANDPAGDVAGGRLPEVIVTNVEAVHTPNVEPGRLLQHGT